MENEFICKFCGKICKNANSLRTHERMCKFNPNHQESYFVKYNHERGAWNKGLTKETDIRLKKFGETLSNGYKTGRIVNANKGRHHTIEEKKNLSEKRKKFLMENPDKVPYLLNHHSKGDSYPEKYFKEILEKENIEYIQNFHQSGYFLDFAFIEKKLYLEIDGEQHYVDKRIVEHDKVRTKKLLNDGWICVERIRWSEYKKMNDDERKAYLKLIFEKIK